MESKLVVHATKATQMYRLGRIHNTMHGIAATGAPTTVTEAYQKLDFVGPEDLPIYGDLKEVQVYINTVSSQLYVEKDFHSLQALIRGLIKM